MLINDHVRWGIEEFRSGLEVGFIYIIEPKLMNPTIVDSPPVMSVLSSRNRLFIIMVGNSQKYLLQEVLLHVHKDGDCLSAETEVLL